NFSCPGNTPASRAYVRICSSGIRSFPSTSTFQTKELIAISKKTKSTTPAAKNLRLYILESKKGSPCLDMIRIRMPDRRRRIFTRRKKSGRRTVNRIRSSSRKRMSPRTISSSTASLMSGVSREPDSSTVTFPLMNSTNALLPLIREPHFDNMALDPHLPRINCANHQFLPSNPNPPSADPQKNLGIAEKVQPLMVFHHHLEGSDHLDPGNLRGHIGRKVHPSGETAAKIDGPFKHETSPPSSF